MKKFLAGTNMGKEIVSATAGAAAGAAVTAVGAAAIGGIRSAADSVFKARHYKNMLGEVPGLRRKRDARKTQAAFNTLWNLNRGIAKDPLAAGSFVERSMNQAELSDSAGIYVDPQTSTMLQKAAPRPYRPVQEAWGTGATKGLGMREGKTILERRPKQFHQEADLALYREQMRRARGKPERVGRSSGLEPPKRR
jgi:hypothetical protein